MNELATTKPAEVFRAGAADLFKATADMSLHELVDEYLRLTQTIEAGKVPAKSGEEWLSDDYTDEAKVALRNRNIVNGAARARFGIGFDVHDYDF
jgi:hypothetical protein